MEMGRARAKGRVGWPDNLYPCGSGYKYRNPVTKKEVWAGNDREGAFDAARKANAALSSRTSLAKKLIGHSETIADAVRVFRKEDMPGRKWAPKTAALYESILKRIENVIGAREISGFAVRDCATFVRDVTEGSRARQQIRLVLGWIMACAVEEGWIEINPALQIRKAFYERQRERLTEDGFNAIWAAASPWLRNAMDLSLLTLLRREDVVSARFSDVHDNALWVVPGKTEDTTGARLKLMGDELIAVIGRCRDDIVSPYLVHRLPEKARPKQKRAKERDHHTQVLPEQLSRAFAEARIAAGVGGENPPTFHEIRSLGASLLREKHGWTVAQVQALMAHSEASMTTHYLEGHEPPWTEVSTALRLSR